MNHAESNAIPACRVSHRPEISWTTTAGVVKIQSASTTLRAVTTNASRLPLRKALSMKKAIPRPVPRSTVAPMIWISFIHR